MRLEGVARARFAQGYNGRALQIMILAPVKTRARQALPSICLPGPGFIQLFPPIGRPPGVCGPVAFRYR